MDAPAAARRSTAPTITALVPAYNEEQWIGEALASILAQTDPPDEIVVVDDGSSDQTAERVEELGADIRLVRQANAGCPAAFNTGFREATGDYVALCPADDIWAPRKVEWQRAALRVHPEIDVAFGGARSFGPKAGPVEQFDCEGLLDGPELRRTLFERNIIPDPSAVIRRELHERLGGYRSDLSGGEDYEFWFRALSAGARFYADTRPVVSLRQHGDNISAQAARVLEVRHLVHREHGGDLGDPAFVRRTLADDLLRLARAQLGLGCVSEARASYRASLRERKTSLGVVASAVLALPGSAKAVRYANRLRR